MSVAVATRSNACVKTIDLSDQCPPGGHDPGGFKSVLYGSLPAVEITSFDEPPVDLEATLQKSVRGDGVLYVLLNLNLRDSRKPRQIDVAQLSDWLTSIGARLIPHHGGRTAPDGPSAWPDREAAIEECLDDWETKLLPRFSW